VKGLLFVKGSSIKKVKEADMLETLRVYIEEITGEKI